MFLRALILTSVFVSTSVFADAPMSGKYHLFSTTGKFNKYLQVSFGAGGQGNIVHQDGSARFSFSSANDSYSLFVGEGVSNISFPLVVDEEYCQANAQDPFACYPKQQRQDSRLTQIELKLQQENVSVSETWYRCIQYHQPTGLVREECKLETSKTYDFYYSQEQPKNDLNIRAGDKIAVSLPENSMGYIELATDGLVNVLATENKNEVSSDIFNATDLVAWEIKDNQLKFITKDKWIVKISAMKDFDGVTRILGTYTAPSWTKTFAGALVVDQDVDMSGLTVNDVAGIYKTVGTDTISQDTEYIFNKDGYGGYIYDTPYGSKKGYSGWVWNLVDSELQTTQYSDLQNNGWPIDEQSELEACVASLQSNPTCEERMSRSFKVLKQDGNRYSMLRILSYGLASEKEVSLSVWTFYKQ